MSTQFMIAAISAGSVLGGVVLTIAGQLITLRFQQGHQRDLALLESRKVAYERYSSTAQAANLSVIRIYQAKPRSDEFDRACSELKSQVADLTEALIPVDFVATKAVRQAASDVLDAVRAPRSRERLDSREVARARTAFAAAVRGEFGVEEA
ncbi:hypothetical protein [Micromonospora chalcea]|uniref:hypothetical protein n=1 Tax=Micromonospora chalcea TaxID=1874 RepID=UPI00332AFA19